MNPAVIQAGLQLLSASLAFIREAKNDNVLLKALVDNAHAEGREVSLDDVQTLVDRMHDDGNALSALIASKTPG